jgi:diguanylate cyclase (GGDEF)-like protein
MMIWDLLTAAACFILVIIAVRTVESGLVRGLVYLVAIACIVLVLLLKYRLIDRHYGRDDVTKRKNKREFERVAKELIKGKRNYVLVYANIDQFKLINDAYGDQVGDEILRKVHKIIDDELVWYEVSGRIMADNFGILMHYHSIEKLDERLYRMSKQFAKLKDDKGNYYGIKMYYGVYILPEDDEADVSAMMERANIARKKVSPSYKVALGVYDDRDRQRLSREKVLEMKMRKALANGEFVPYLQPKYELKGETVAGAEALVRWIDPEEGMIYPDEFIPLFENNGFVVDVDLYMFEQVCKMAESWHKQGKRIIPISVNLSRSHFAVPNFFDSYAEILKKYDVPPKAIEIELTESLFYNDMDSLNTLVSQIHELGLSCSIDDFGSGYSSLNMLKEVRVDALKLDRVFFASGEDDQRGKNVIQSVIRLAQALNLHTISEGVEERGQVDFLKSMDCDLVQGYVFAKPMPVGDFEELAFRAK